MAHCQRSQHSQHDRQRQHRPSPRRFTPGQEPSLEQRHSARRARPSSYSSSSSLQYQSNDIPAPFRSTASEQHSARYESMYLPQEQHPYSTAHTHSSFPESVFSTGGGASDARMASSLLHPSRSSGLNNHASPYQLESAYRAPSPMDSTFTAPVQALSHSRNQQMRSSASSPQMRARIRSASHLPDSTFAHPEDFHLFVQATAGLGPEQLSSASSSTSDEYATSVGEWQSSSAVLAEQYNSPLQETPTTIRALHELARLPVSTQTMPVRSSTRTNIPQQPSWLQPPESFEDDESHRMDEELPDYAMSQAQAQAAQRLEATRRAQELQRRWQQSR